MPCRHALLLQGPNGPFFDRFREELESMGVVVTRINFNAGDKFYYHGENTIDFKGTREEWPAYFREALPRIGADAVFVFGDGRPMHVPAVEIAHELGVDVWVFEQGYLRPHWVTLERDGVNGRSRMPKDAEFFIREAASLGPAPEPVSVGITFRFGAWYSTGYAMAQTLFNGFLFPKYEHHREINCWWHAASWVRGGYRKLYFQRKERGIQERLAGELSGRYFFAPLQVYCDNQLTYSDFESIEAFVEEVVAEFARSGRADDHLVFKHHPMDRPFREYSAFFEELRERSGLGERLIYVHDLHLPTLLEHARGTITMNSTVGLQSLEDGTPVKVLGGAVYNFPRMTYGGTLSEFLEAPGEVDAEAVDAFCTWLLHTNQVNGHFFKQLDGSRSPTGFRYFDASPLPWSTDA